MLRQVARHTLQQSKRIVLSKSFATAFIRPTGILKQSFSNNGIVAGPLLARQFSYSNVAQQPSYTVTELSTDRYHRLSNEVLEHICSKLEELMDEVDEKGYDVEYSQGVMTISLGEHGTYVINKQPPNHQIWLSSPISGPQRYDYDEKHKKWFYHRDNHTLDKILNQELSKAFEQDIDLLEGFESSEQ